MTENYLADFSRLLFAWNGFVRFARVRALLLHRRLSNRRCLGLVRALSLALPMNRARRIFTPSLSMPRLLAPKPLKVRVVDSYVFERDLKAPVRDFFGEPLTWRRPVEADILSFVLRCGGLMGLSLAESIGRVVLRFFSPRRLLRPFIVARMLLELTTFIFVIDYY